MLEEIGAEEGTKKKNTHHWVMMNINTCYIGVL